MDARLQQVLAGGSTKAAVEDELLGDLEQSGNSMTAMFGSYGLMGSFVRRRLSVLVVLQVPFLGCLILECITNILMIVFLHSHAAQFIVGFLM